ncbi:hypothetical protein SAMN05216415_1325 [Streptococcus equinus]|uniref:Uncharacterized protein n=1 Tax=Streptococcus equinus TaxID=1335 RepID=A0AAE8L3X2_STREI|nr:hypothetical protein SAMN05216415_1325 [Streptococcus equinus]
MFTLKKTAKELVKYTFIAPIFVVSLLLFA